MTNLQPQSCNPDIYNNGICVGIIHTYPSTQIEAFVRYASQLSGQDIDWHFVGGRGMIKTLANTEAGIEAVKNAFYDLRLDPQNTDLVPNG